MSDSPKFPESMTSIRKRFPGKLITQVRIIYRDGSHLEVEGPITENEARLITAASMGHMRTDSKAERNLMEIREILKQMDEMSPDGAHKAIFEIRKII